MENKLNHIPSSLQSDSMRIDKFPFLWRSYKSFKSNANELCDEYNYCRIEPSEMKRQYVKHIIYCLFVVLILGCILFGVKMLVAGRKPKYDRVRYRKVVKEGLFWDSVEYHER